MPQPTSKARLVITALFVDHQTPAEVAARYGVHRAWVYKLKARYEAEGETALEPRSRRPKTSPAALSRRGGRPDRAGPQGADRRRPGRRPRDHRLAPAAPPRTPGVPIDRSAATSPRQGLVTPEPKKRPKSSYIRFEASMPNETWQSDFTHYRLTRPDGRPGADVEIISWLDDCTRYALHVTAHHADHHPDRAQPPSAEALAQHGIPASTLTDNGMVYTVRLAGHGRQGGKNSFEAELHDRHIVQKNSRPGHPTTCGKAERFQQTMKKWLRAQPVQPSTIAELQALLDLFTDEYNHRRPHRSLPHRATPATLYDSMPKAAARPGHRPRDPRTDPARPRRQSRLGHPAPQQPTPPHRHRPNPRRNLRHPARPGPPDPRRQRRHRRTPPRTDPRPQPRLPAHRSTQRTHPQTPK